MTDDSAPRPSAYRIFDAVVARTVALSPHMRRVTFAGEPIRGMATHAPDQRIKLFLPHADGRPPALPDREDWYDAWRAVPPAERPPMRSYTIRHLRPELGELDVDFVLHGDGGPASRWAIRAVAGDAIQISAPDARYRSAALPGFEWKPPAGLRRLLLVADETALPAIAGILETVASWTVPPATQALLEIPGAADALPLATWPGLDLRWLPRDGAGHGALLFDAVRGAILPQGLAAGTAVPVPGEDDVLWDQAQPGDAGFYAWIAGETVAVGRIRKFLVGERGIDRRCITFMGYWREGKEMA